LHGLTANKKKPSADFYPYISSSQIYDMQIMAIGDGENDVEMLQLASLGVALSNGSKKTKAVANVIGLSNDEDGVADAIYRYAF
jgi:hydroxymethylpyrimidine pyrophosphatase-like HAD family hydrolase